jgi:hypothetical protein
LRDLRSFYAYLRRLTMVYDWEDKQEICYQMYIKEKRALEEIMEHMKNVYQFAPRFVPPSFCFYVHRGQLDLHLSASCSKDQGGNGDHLFSKRAFQTQFKRWDFPSKHNPAHKNADLVARVKELWGKNKSQRDMLRILKEEGYHINERELMRVRAKNRWLLRVPNGAKARKIPHIVLGEDPSQEAGNQEILETRKAESTELRTSPEQRSQTLEWAGLPADPPNRPRFPSETTIHESKRYLKLDKSLYQEIRNQFQRICEEAGFFKKTIAGPERWQAAKNRLIHESPHLQAIFCSDPSQLDTKTLALDIVCTDVTKRMRTLERRMTIAEAKNALGINPEESRQIKNAFYNILEVNHFTSKLDAGGNRWKELKNQWIRESELLQNILSAEFTHSENTTKNKALEVLCRDVMKRFRDVQTKQNPRNPIDASQSPSRATLSNSVDSECAVNIPSGISALASNALASTPMVAAERGDIQIDPSLLQATSNPPFALLPPTSAKVELRDVDQLLVLTFPVSIYLQIEPGAAESWVDRLMQPSLEELRRLIGLRYPNKVLERIQGIERSGHDDKERIMIDDNAKLEAYLVQSQGDMAYFEIFLDCAEGVDECGASVIQSNAES